jgi:hypothetical protein
LALLAIIVVVMGAVFFALSGKMGEKSQYIVPVAVLASLAYQSLLASMQLPAGFRGDLDRMDWLKSLPLKPTAIVCGQVTGAALLVSALQVMVLVAAWALCGGAFQIYLAGLVMFVPVNLLCFAVDNLVFLIFPMRASASTAGDFQFMGRFMLVAMFKMLLMAVGLATASLGAILYLIVPQLWLAIGCCLLLLIIVDALVVFLATQVFVRFDVSLDTPPAA